MQLGGADVTLHQTNLQATTDLGFADLLACPLLALLAVLIFRGIAALLPLGVGITSGLGSLLMLRLINAGLPLSSFALNVVVGLGLGLSIDYSLILVSRFREELSRGAATADAITTTFQTAGRTVIFSALTVAAAMASLTVIPLRFLQSIGIGGAVVALVAATTSLRLLPALFVLLGARLGKAKPTPSGQGFWYRLARGVMRHPGIIATATITGLILLAVPTLSTKWTGVDASMLPTSQSSRVVSDTMAHDYPDTNANPTFMAINAPSEAGPQLATYAYPVAVGGQAAEFHDQQSSIAASLPLGLAILALSTLIILWLMTGSIILPMKALAMNALTVGASLGLLVLVFKHGRLTGPLAYTSQGGIEATDFLVPALMALLQDRNWWSPTPLRHLHQRLTGSHRPAAQDRADPILRRAVAQIRAVGRSPTEPDDRAIADALAPTRPGLPTDRPTRHDQFAATPILCPCASARTPKLTPGTCCAGWMIVPPSSSARRKVAATSSTATKNRTSSSAP